LDLGDTKGGAKGESTKAEDLDCSYRHLKDEERDKLSGAEE